MMKVTEVGPKSVHKGDKCRHCSKTVKTGDVIAWCRTDRLVTGHFSIHVDCMSLLVERAPETDFERTRNRILTEGVWA